MKRFICVMTAIVLLPGCASAPNKIPASYISPLQYDAYDREQLAGELERINVRISELEGQLKRRAWRRREDYAWCCAVLARALLSGRRWS